MLSSGCLPDHILQKMDPAVRAKLGKAGLTREEAAAAFVLKSERDLQKLIAQDLQRNGVWFTRSAMNKKATNTVGTPDFLFALRGAA